MDSIPLWVLGTGQRAVIAGFDPVLPEAYRQRLTEMGFHGGERVTCLRQPAFGAPRVYRVSNTVFSLDREIAAHILMQPEGVET
ncbi:MAG: FeoA family protein [Wenzhouxiangellaceae bacterium]